MNNWTVIRGSLRAVLMRANDEAGPPKGAAFAPVGVGRGIALVFRVPHTPFSRVDVLNPLRLLMKDTQPNT
jgi:hypothetical protein